MNKKPRNSTIDLRKKIDSHIKDLAQMTTDATRSEAFKNFLDTCARFYNYSPTYQFLIYTANPQATFVAGYRAWNKFNRYVRKGEQGIPILAPCIYKTDPDRDDSPRELRGFRVVYVFDITQTDGEPLPDPPEWKSPARMLLLENRLIDFAASRGIQVDRSDLPGDAQGVSKGGAITLDPTAGTKTLIHEIAHEMLHQAGKEIFLDPHTKELEAEAVAYVVATHFGLPDLASPNYLALWSADEEKILARQDRIRTCAVKLISAIEPNE